MPLLIIVLAFTGLCEASQPKKEKLSKCQSAELPRVRPAPKTSEGALKDIP